ncbi:MAG TPA: hypothetical protein DCF68_13565 [Cyanothece sp. UBA12306]|nr:hypothetical protein [Cyanothece sp. UBA12306]
MQLLSRKFTVNEYQKMSEVGILNPEDRVELIHGQIIPMSPIGLKHAAMVKRLNTFLTYQLYNQAIIGVQDPIQIDDFTQPQPDIFLLAIRSDFYELEIPKPQDILAVIEVCDTTIRYDREIKIPLYATSNIPETWLINLNNQSLEVYRNPQNQNYQTKQVLNKNQTISLLAFPQLIIKLTEFFI